MYDHLRRILQQKPPSFYMEVIIKWQLIVLDLSEPYPVWIQAQAEGGPRYSDGP